MSREKKEADYVNGLGCQYFISNFFFFLGLWSQLLHKYGRAVRCPSEEARRPGLSPVLQDRREQHSSRGREEESGGVSRLGFLPPDV